MITEKQAKKPLVPRQPLVLTKCRTMQLPTGPARVEYNPLTCYSEEDGFMVWAPDHPEVGMYDCASLRDAAQMAKTVNYYIETGKRKAFTGPVNKELIWEIPAGEAAG